MIIHYKRIMWFQTKISHGLSWHYHTYNVSSGDPHDMYGRWITLRIYWGQLRTRVTWCFSALYINVIPVQCRMCPASVWHGSLRASLCLSWWTVPRMQVWKYKLCCFGWWISTGRSAPCQRWVYCQYTVCPMTHTHDFAVFLFRCGYITSGFVWYTFPIFQGGFSVTGWIVWRPRWQWSNPEVYV